MKSSEKIAFYDEEEALAFSDVYLSPSYSDIRSRFGKQIDTSTSIAIGAPKLNIPFISAGMDTVTEDEMATVLALNGGVGEIHRNNTPEKQAELVQKVKEKMRVMEKNPPMVSEKATIGDALSLLAKRNRGYVIIYKGSNFKGKFSGMATDKDFLVGDSETQITAVMTPFEDKGVRTLITGDEKMGLPDAVSLMKEKRIEKLPIIDKEKAGWSLYLKGFSKH